MQKSKIHKFTIQKVKRLPKAGIIYAVRSEDIVAIKPCLSANTAIRKLNSNNNKVISHQLSDTSWNSSDSGDTAPTSSSKSVKKSDHNKENCTQSITSDNVMDHLFIDTNNNHTKLNNPTIPSLNTNQNSLIVQRGSFGIPSDKSIESSEVNEPTGMIKNTQSDKLVKETHRIKSKTKTSLSKTGSRKSRTQTNSKSFGNRKSTSREDHKVNWEKQIPSKDIPKEWSPLIYKEKPQKNKEIINYSNSLSKTDSQVSTKVLDVKPRRLFLDVNEKECDDDSDSSLKVCEERSNDNLLALYEDVSLELSRLKLKYNELVIENSTVKQVSENLSKEIENLKYENTNVKTRNETLAAKNLENQNLSRIVDSLNQKVKELCQEIEKFQTKDSVKTRRLVEMETNVIELQEKEATSTVDMEHLRNQLIQKDLEIKRLAHNQKVDEEKDLQMKLIHNELIELKGNIRVLCRIKPEPNNLIQIVNNETLQLPSQKCKSFWPMYNFNRVFKSNANQGEIFSEVRQLITSFVDGYNVNMITYGQSGSGKTFTMIGTKDQPGIVTHSIREVFKLCSQRTSWSFRVCLSVLEIYNETIFDLLTTNQSSKPGWKKRTQIHDDGKCIHIKGLSEIEIKHEEDLLSYVIKSGKNRSSCMTTQNSDSSRSHFIVMLRIHGKNTFQNCATQGVLMLCDLAGSENCTCSLTENSMTESKYISKSLTVLGRVFEALYNKLLVIPFRDSKLTHILKPSLTGDAKFAFIVTVSGKAENLNNSIRVLNLARKVAQISLGQPHKNTISAVGKVIGRAELLCQSG